MRGTCLAVATDKYNNVLRQSSPGSSVSKGKSLKGWLLQCRAVLCNVSLQRHLPQQPICSLFHLNAPTRPSCNAVMSNGAFATAQVSPGHRCWWG